MDSNLHPAPAEHGKCPLVAHLPSTAHTEATTPRSTATQAAGMATLTPRLLSPIIRTNPAETRRIPPVNSHISVLSVRVWHRHRQRGLERARRWRSCALSPLSSSSVSHFSVQSRRSSVHVNQSPAPFHLTHAECPALRSPPPRRDSDIQRSQSGTTSRLFPSVSSFIMMTGEHGGGGVILRNETLKTNDQPSSTF